MRNVPFLAQGIPSLPPGKSHRVLLDSAVERNTSDLPDSYNVTVTYTGFDGHEYVDTQVIDISIFYGAPDLVEHNIHDIWHQLDAMKRSLHGIHGAIANLRPSPSENFPPLPRAVLRPGSVQEMPHSVEGGGFPSNTASVPAEQGEGQSGGDLEMETPEDSSQV